MQEKKSKTALWLIAVLGFVVLMVGAYILYDHLSAGQEAGGAAATERQPAPDFTVVDADGTEVSLSDFIGKPVIVNFWASWCGPCKSEMPDFDAVYDEYGDKVQFMMINMTDGSRETVEVAAEFIAQQGYTFPVFYDVDYSAAIAYGVSAIPVTYFIDADGNLAAQARSAIDAATIEKGIGMILEK